MMRKALLAALVLLLVVCAGAYAAPVPLKAVNYTPANPFDVSHMCVYTYNSPLNPVEKDQVFIGHNASDLFLGVKLYDNDNAKDEVVIFYIYASGVTYRVVAKEGNASASLTTSTGTLITSVPEHSTVSSVNNPYCEMIVNIPLTDIGNPATISVYVQRNSTVRAGMLIGAWNMANDVQIGHMSFNHYMHPPFLHKHCNCKKMEYYFILQYPPDSSLADPTTWMQVQLVDTLGTNTFTINIPKVTPYMVLALYNNSYTANPLTQVPITTAGNYTISAPNFTSYAIMLGGNLVSTTSGIVPGGFVLAYPKTILNLTASNYTTATLNISSATLNNETFNIVPAVTVNTGAVINVSATTDTPVYAFATGKFIVMRARDVAYNPLTEHWEFVVPADRTVIVKPTGVNLAILMANCLCNMEYHAEKHMLKLEVGNGTVIIQNPVNKTINGTFAVVHNGTAMKRMKQYHDDDRGNITVINTTAGNLTIYYTNPCSVKVFLNGTNVTVQVRTPYTFHGRVNVTVAGKVVFSKNVTIVAPGGNYSIALSNITSNITSTSNLTATSILATGSPVVTVYDLDSLKTIGSESVRLKSLIAPFWVVLAIVIVVGAIAAVVLMVRKKTAKAAVKVMEQRSRYFRRIK